MVFRWSLSNRKSPKVSRTFLSILAVLNKVVVWMLSTRPLISKTPSPFFFQFPSNSLFFFPLSFSFILSSAKSTILQVLFIFVDYYKVYYLISLVDRVFANDPSDLGRVIPKTLKMVLDISLLNTQQYKARIEGKMKQSRERGRALP